VPNPAPPRLPWRDSALTQLLCGPLGGGAAVTILACVSPTADHARLSHRTLKYAAECARIRVDPVPLDMLGIDVGSTELRASDEELQRLTELADSSSARASLEAMRADAAETKMNSLRVDLDVMRRHVSSLLGSTRGLLAAHQRVVRSVGGLVESV